MNKAVAEPLTPSAVVEARRGIAVISRRRARLPPFHLMAPALILLALIVYVPMLFAFYISGTGLNQYTITDWIRAPFVGLRNYIDSINPNGPLAGTLLGSIRASVLFSVLTTVLITPIGVGAALLLNTGMRGRSILRGLMLLPYVIPTFVVGLVWRLIFMNDTGIADRLLASLHLASQQTFWLIGPNSIWAMIAADVWHAWPFVYLMALAGLQTIPEELYDAAAIDGASGVRRLRHITLPLLWPTLSLALLLSTINHFNNFTLPFVMFGSSPPQEVYVLPLNIYVHSFITFSFGLGAAMSVLSLIIVMIPAVLYLRATGLGRVE